MDFILKHFPASLRVKNFCHTCQVRPPQLTAACVTPLPSSTSPIRTPVVPHQNRRRHTLTISRPHLFANRLILEPTFVIDAVVRRHSLYIPLPPSRAPLSQSPPRNRRLLARHLPFNRDFAHRFRAKQCCAAFANANDQNFECRLAELTTLAPMCGRHV